MSHMPVGYTEKKGRLPRILSPEESAALELKKQMEPIRDHFAQIFAVEVFRYITGENISDSKDHNGMTHAQVIAFEAYRLADAMIWARNGGGREPVA